MCGPLYNHNSITASEMLGNSGVLSHELTAISDLNVCVEGGAMCLYWVQPNRNRTRLHSQRTEYTSTRYK